MNFRFAQSKLCPVVCAATLALALSSHAGLFTKKQPPAPPAPPAPPVITNVPQPVVAKPTPPPAPAAPGVLTWDSDQKESHPKLGDPTANFEFFFTNTSPVDVVITQVKPSCGCTTAHLPPTPWTNAPGAYGKIELSVDLHGKMGQLIKTVNVDSTAGPRTLMLKIFMPDPQAERDRNMQQASADRQAVFKDTCASCHVTPTKGKMGQELYQTACGICHEAEHRATMVADLHSLKHPTDREFWKTWITYGKPFSLMPAFAESQGGPLNDEQVSSLADYLTKAIPSSPQ
jgi:mono/diheme cytochrome c family protein